MASLIIKINGLYANWSMTTNAPISPFMTREQYLEYCAGCNQRRLTCDMKLADETGVSCISVTLKELIASNCAGVDSAGIARGIFTMLKPCCESCPEYGMNQSMAPSPYEMKLGVESGIVWMCHSNPATPCWATGLAKLRHGDIPVTSEGDFWKRLG